MSSTEKRKRNRVKIECLECGSTFDKDYRGKHERTQHGGEKVRIKHVGAPKNPFEAAIKISKVNKKNIISCIKFLHIIYLSIIRVLYNLLNNKLYN